MPHQWHIAFLCLLTQIILISEKRHFCGRPLKYSSQFAFARKLSPRPTERPNEEFIQCGRRKIKEREWKNRRLKKKKSRSSSSLIRLVKFVRVTLRFEKPHCVVFRCNSCPLKESSFSLSESSIRHMISHYTFGCPLSRNVLYRFFDMFHGTFGWYCSHCAVRNKKNTTERMP